MELTVTHCFLAVHDQDAALAFYRDTLGLDVVADVEAERVAIEGEGGVRILVRQEAGVNRDVHGGHASCGSLTGASRFLTGRVTCLATHDGIPAVACAACRR